MGFYTLAKQEHGSMDLGEKDAKYSAVVKGSL